MEELVTVIIPVYNLADCLKKSLTSVLNQTYHKLEILLIDDGSKDDTLACCKDLAEDDNRIRVIHQENSGVSAARNTGLEHSTGDLVTFIDGDDIIAPFYIASLVNEIKCNILSMCMHERVRDYSYKFQLEGVPYQIIGAQECGKRLLSGNFPVSVCGTLFRRDLIGEQRFPLGIKNNEDKYFLYEYLLRNQHGTVAFTNQKMYGYYVREGSATRSSWDGSRDTIKMADEMNRLTKKYHPEWRDISDANMIVVRLGILKSIIQSKNSSAEAKGEYHSIKKEILSKSIPTCANRSTKIEYAFLKMGDVFYKVLVKTYYGFMSDARRDKRNEQRVRQG